MSRTFVIGDIHGAYPSLLECFEKAGFRSSTDRLICLGDACDGWPGVSQVMEILAGLPHLRYILGNHDQWALEWIQTGMASPLWLRQGGQACLDAYPGGMPSGHYRVLETAVPYLVEDRRLYIHGGYNTDSPIEDQDPKQFLWNRDLVRKAFSNNQKGEGKPISPYRQIFIGHTPTLNYGSQKPLHFGEVCLMDTGAGWTGPLSMMNVDTGEVFQGEPAFLHYPKSRGRM